MLGGILSEHCFWGEKAFDHYGVGWVQGQTNIAENKSLLATCIGKAGPEKAWQLQLAFWSSFAKKTQLFRCF